MSSCLVVFAVVLDSYFGSPCLQMLCHVCYHLQIVLTVFLYAEHLFNIYYIICELFVQLCVLCCFSFSVMWTDLDAFHILLHVDITGPLC